MENLQLPIAFENRMKAYLGAEFADFLYCYSNDRYQALRLNPLKKGLDMASLAGDRKMVPWAVNGYYYEGEEHPGKHPYHEMGLYYIQEPSAMSAAAVLAPKPGMRVLDLCAAPGGKTTQLASYLGQQGLLVANEINPTRAKILSSNVERMGIRNAIVTNEDSGKMRDFFPSFFHAILVDSPCSGEGMFRKNPEAITEWSEDNVKLCATRSAEILDNAAQMLLPGGTMVYSTCTFAPEENEQEIIDFLLRHEEFVLLHPDLPWFAAGRGDFLREDQKGKQVTVASAMEADVSTDDNARYTTVSAEEAAGMTYRLWPHKLHGEGHFVAVLQKLGELPAYAFADSDAGTNADTNADTNVDINAEATAEGSGDSHVKPSRKKDAVASKRYDDRRDKKFDKKADKKGKGGKSGSKSGLSADQEAALAEFLPSLNPALADWIRSGKLVMFGDQLYRLPDGAPSLAGLRVLRAGLHIGECKKDRLEPSHALALTMGQEDAATCVHLTAEDPRTLAFFRGESFFAEEREIMGSGKGWCLVCVDHCSAGWGKLANGQVKNHYPKGLRRDLKENISGNA